MNTERRSSVPLTNAPLHIIFAVKTLFEDVVICNYVGVEMDSIEFYGNAAKARKEALGITIVSKLPFKKDVSASEQCQNGFFVATKFEMKAAFRL